MPASTDPLSVLFHAIMRDPPLLLAQEVRLQNRLLRMLRRHLLLGSVAVRLDAAALRDAPPRLCDLLDAARTYVVEYRRQLRWEVRQIAHALHTLDVPVVLLKGAAYEFLGLPNARGRLVSDVDILVAKEDLARVEQALLANGWRGMKLDEYDQGYYREWMHELPPLQHRERGTIVDVHHAILPVTSRLKPDAGKMLAAARPLPNTPFRVLSPEDMLLHACVHLFHDGDLGNGLRELYDLHAMLDHFGAGEAFWPGLLARAAEQGLERPLYYALYHLSTQLAMDLPAEAARALREFSPPRGLRGLANAAMGEMLRPVTADEPGWKRQAAGELLYIRSHWLRMPPLLLARHLLTKARKRRKTIQPGQDLARGRDVPE